MHLSTRGAIMMTVPIALDTLRRALLAVALGVAPLASGCVSQVPLPTDVAKARAPWSGPPLPLLVGVTARGRPDQLLVTGLARQSFVNVLRATRVFAGVRDLASPVPPGAAVAKRPVDLIFRVEVMEFDLYSSYLWWIVYGGFFAIPFVGTGSAALALIALGAPVAIDFGAMRMKVTATDPRTGRVVGRYEGYFETSFTHTLYNSQGVSESVIAHPEIMLQGASTGAVEEIARDRFWLVRLRR